MTEDQQRRLGVMDDETYNREAAEAKEKWR